LPLIGPANAAIARYDGVLHGVPNPNVLLSPLTAQEAVLSSRIEGTQATLGEVLEFEAKGELFDESTPKKADTREVLNYRAALYEAIRLLDEMPLSQRLIRETHKVLIQGVRGHNRSPGEYHRIPNWIGPTGCTIEQARFVPCGAERLLLARDERERYLHAAAPDRLVQLAIVHAEFARLLDVSGEDDWTGWCEFFLRALIAQAEENQTKAQEILSLYRERKDWVVEVTRSQYAVRALDWIFVRPIFRTSDFIESVDIPRPTANRILREVRDQGLLREIRPASGRRGRILAFPTLLNIAEGKTAF
jgi:Fic family protein